jgi:hypothetical protein
MKPTTSRQAPRTVGIDRVRLAPRSMSAQTFHRRTRGQAATGLETLCASPEEAVAHLRISFAYSEQRGRAPHVDLLAARSDESEQRPRATPD